MSTSVNYKIEAFGLNKLKRSTTKYGPLEKNKIRVQIKAISINYRDLLMIEGHYNPRMNLPVIPISDGSGVVMESGSSLLGFNEGDHVCTTMIPDWESGTPEPRIHQTTLGGPNDGCLSEIRDFFPNEIMKVPKRLSFEKSATLPVAGLTAWNALSLIEHHPHTMVLLLGSGGVSLAALGIGKALGVQTIITSSSDEKLALADKLGADHGINYRTFPKWSREVRKIVPHGCNLVVEVGGSGTINQSLSSTMMGGKIALIGVLADSGQNVNLTKMLMSKIDVHGIIVGSRSQFKKYIEFVEKTDVTPNIGHQFHGIDSITEALHLMKSGKHFGKIVISY